jgi:hypothetical protein
MPAGAGRMPALPISARLVAPLTHSVLPDIHFHAAW